MRSTAQARRSTGHTGEFCNQAIACQVLDCKSQCARLTNQARRSTGHTKQWVNLGVNILTSQCTLSTGPYARSTGYTVYSDFLAFNFFEIVIVCGAH